MAKRPPKSAADFVPPRPTLKTAREASKGCRGCDLWKLGTQTVFGEGPRGAPLMLIGEQPGDAEDLSGHPFVGPAGKLLDRALEEAGIDRGSVYVTNAVKHFKWEPRGKRRIHKKPRASEIGACRPWLDVEIALVKPKVIVCLGATAAQALLGSAFKVTAHRGKVAGSRPWLGEAREGGAAKVIATVHPSSILRAPDPDARHEELKRFTDDLRAAARALSSE
jgi:uracil-DNA glycosylase